MANLASAITRLDDARPRPGRRRLRDHRPGARHRGRCCAATSTTSTRASSALTGDLDTIVDDRASRSASAIERATSCPAAATTSPTAPRSSGSTPTTRPRSTGARSTSSAAVRRRHPHAARRGRAHDAHRTVDPEPVRRASGTSGRSRSAATRSRSSSASSPRSGSASGAGSPAAAGRRHPGPRDLGGAVRPGRRPALPRGHRPRPLLRRGQHPIEALYVWRGGLGVWGAIALGASASSSAPGARASGSLPVLDAMAPGVLVAQAHRPLGQLVQPGALRQAHRPAVGPRDRRRAPAARLLDQARRSTRRSSTSACGASRVRAVVIWADRRFRLGHGRVVALYVMLYTLGRGWIEMLRIDDVELDDVARPAVQRVDLDRAVRRGGWSTSWSAPGCSPGREEHVVRRGPRAGRRPPRTASTRPRDRGGHVDACPRPGSACRAGALAW